MAFSYAAIADSEARAWLASRTIIDRGSGCGPAVIQPRAITFKGALPDHPEHQGNSWWDRQSTPINHHPELGTRLNPDFFYSGSASWLIEEIHCQPANQDSPLLIAWYRVLSRYAGKWPGSIVVTESIVARPWGETIQPGLYPGPGSMASFCSQFTAETPCGRKAWRQRR